jgi:hypothetical protein
MLPRLTASLSLPFPNKGPIRLWQPRLRQYRQRQIDFLEALIADWQCHRGGLCREVMDHIVCEYLFGMKLRQFCALDAEYVAPILLPCAPAVATVASVETAVAAEVVAADDVPPVDAALAALAAVAAAAVAAGQSSRSQTGTKKRGRDE